MRLRFVLLVAGSVTAPGCVAARAPAAAPPRASDPGDARLDAVATAAGLTPLHATRLASGEREVRVWIGGMGYPQRLYRISDREGAVTGEVIDYWPLDRDSTQPPAARFERVIRYYEAGACGRVRRRGVIETCRVRFARRPDWPHVLRTVEAAGVWTLPDEEAVEPGRIVIDGWRVRVETRAGGEFRTYQYRNPDHSTSAEAQHALAIARALQALHRLARPASAEHVWRGIYSAGPGVRAFQPCGSPATYHLDGDLRRLPDGWVDAPQGDTLAHPIVRRYAEVRGTLEPAALAATDQAEHRRQLTVSAVLSVSAVPPAGCSAAH